MSAVEGSSTRKGIIRRVSSRSFFGSNKDKDQDANASTDTLASTATGRTSRMEMARKAGEALSRTAALPHWSRRSKKAGSSKRDSSMSTATDESDEMKNTTIRSSGRPRSFAAVDGYTDLTARGEGETNDETSYLTASSENLGSATNGSDNQERGEGIPKRLSGWLSTMLGSNGSPSPTHLERQGDLSASESAMTVRRKASNISLARQEGADSNATMTLSPPDSSTTNASQTPISKSRSVGLLSSLSASGRARMENGSSINGGGGGARSGLDRALRYFLDSGEQEQGQEEGIWLLGVWHGPKEPEKLDSEDASPSPASRQLPATAEVSEPSMVEREEKTSTVEGGTSSPSRRGSDWDNDDTSTEDSSRKTRETSPSIASASTGGSTDWRGKLHVGGERSVTPDEGQVVARNPPTPHASPSIPPRIAAVVLPPTPPAPSLSTRDRDGPVPAIASHMASFQSDFSSRIWCTYRSHFVPITRDGSISSQAEVAAEEAAANTQSMKSQPVEGAEASTATSPSFIKAKSKRSGEVDGNGERQSLSNSPMSAHQMGTSPSSQGSLAPSLGIHPHQASPLSSGLGDKMGIPNLWSRATAAAQVYGLSGRSGLTTDAGWGCMLRTGQSVLANALLNVHLGRDWRRVTKPRMADESPVDGEGAWAKRQQEYATYVRLLSWFMDEPSLACPFGVHRMAREGKRLGKEVGEWFGPSTAAGAIKKLVDEYPQAGLGVSMASDGVVYLNQVKSQAQVTTGGKHRSLDRWERPVLVLIGIRLGLEGVHPMYHESIKATFSFPQSVGIAGGRPSSSYYFVGCQGNSLFYLDPHHVRSSVSFRHPPPGLADQTSWWVEAYSEAELASYHNDRARRMPMKSLDPSMLLGFLISDDASLCDFVSRVKALPRPIFSVLDSMPRWMMEDDEGTLDEDEKALESFSEGSLDEDLGRGEVGSDEAEETLEGGREGGEGGGREGDRERQTGLNQSMMSNRTTTPRSESTFEFIDSQAATLMRQSPPSEMRNHHVFVQGSVAFPPATPPVRARRVASTSQSVTDSDGGSGWEEVGSDSANRTEAWSSSPVGTAQ